jgi:hypothetical protein
MHCQLVEQVDQLLVLLVNRGDARVEVIVPRENLGMFRQRMGMRHDDSDSKLSPCLLLLALCVCHVT